MFFFFKFHRKLMKENKTTIENLEHKSKPYLSKYDISSHHNFEQVMGTNKWLWAIPIMPASAKPKGEGIYFDKNCDSEGSEGEEDETPEDNVQQERNPINFQRRDGEESKNIQSTSKAPNLSSTSNLRKLGQPVEEQSNGHNNVERITKQGDKMTIHNERTNQWNNLTNIVKADNPHPQVYKSSGSEENSAAQTSNVANKQQYTNEIESKGENDGK